MKAMKDHLKNYDDQNITHEEFKVEEHAYLRILPKRSSMRMGGGR